MKKILIVSVLASGLSACANLPFMGPPPATTPDTPVFFLPNSARLDRPALSAVESAAKAAATAPGETVYVTGAADTVGSSADNAALAQARASAVANALEADGVDVSRVHIRSAGEVTGLSATAQSARRVLIHIGA
jgi:OOP family OmpA-OmpF porin